MMVAAHVRRLSESSTLTADDLLEGVEIDGQRLPIIDPGRGIFKPKELQFLLSIRTIYPRRGRRIWYEDQTRVLAQIEAGEEVVDYSFEGSDPNKHTNQWLLRAMEEKVPILYFLGIAPARYTAHYPTFVVDWSPVDLQASIAFGSPPVSDERSAAPGLAERKYAMRIVRQRLHQARFREAVLSAYGNRCAISRLPEPRLLDAAHIIGDLEDHGLPIVPNGLPLSKVHHAAFDANLIGIDSNFQIHVSEKLLSVNDGPMLEQGLKLKHGQKIDLPYRRQDWPDRERLEARFELFRTAAH